MIHRERNSVKGGRKMATDGIFLDSSDVKEISNFHQMGIISGVTTNPTIMVKDGVKDFKARSIEIAELVDPLPVSVEVLSNNPDEMIHQALEFSSWAPNINVKIPIHGPNGEMDNLRFVSTLEDAMDVRVNVTAMMSVQQAFLAAQAGATYVSLFGGRINNMGYPSTEEIKKLRILLTEFGLDSKIIVGSVREAMNVMQWLISGAHIVTVPPEFIETMIVHPYSKETVQMFLDDAKVLNE